MCAPDFELAFRDVYGQVCSEAGFDLPDTVYFSDADFAGCIVTLKSTWKLQRQSIRATRACESEYVATFDAMKLSFLEWFL